jgi:hypothetical protein
MVPVFPKSVVLLFEFTQPSIFEVDKSQVYYLCSPFSLLGCQTVCLQVQVAKAAASKKQVSGLPTRSVPMDENSDREELEKKLEQSRRMAAGQTDPVRQGWLLAFVRDLERRLQDEQ